MRESVIARTIYRPEHFSGQQLFFGSGGVTLGPPPYFKPKLSPTCSFWPVGAIDLRYHDDAYFNQFLPQLTLREALGQSGPTKFGTLDFRWIPPAAIESMGEGYYRITNPEECAAAANAQSEQDYADLLSISGYPELLRLAILFRNEATEPSISQTVRAQTPLLYRNPEPITSVIVESNPIPYSGDTIKAWAGREPQDCLCKVEVWTQPIKRASPVKYRVVLRTLDSYWGKDSWRDISYADYQLVNYQADPQNVGFLHLDVSHGSIEVANSPLIAEWTSSPAQDPIQREGTVTMEAVTFDWWVPVPLFRPLGGTRDNLLNSALLGQHDPQSVPHPGGAQMLRDLRLGSPIFQNNGRLIPELTWKAQSGDPDGQRRDLRKAMVHIRYELGWIEDRLRLTIWNDPADRSYIVFLALEEQMQGSSTIFHTAVPLPVNGFLTYVPQDFFDKEFEALARTGKIIASLVPKHLLSVGEIGSNNGINWIRPGDLASREGNQPNHDADRTKQSATISRGDFGSRACGASVHTRGGEPIQTQQRAPNNAEWGIERSVALTSKLRRISRCLQTFPSAAIHSRRPRDISFSPTSDQIAALRQPTFRAMYGRRPRCKMNLTFCEAFGCSHVSGLFSRGGFDHLVARNTRDDESAIPISCAVRRLTTNSNLVGCSIGRSAGLVPRKILSTKTVMRR